MRGPIRVATFALALLLVVGHASGVLMNARQATPIAATDVAQSYSPGVVITEFGPVEVPADPQRVVTLSEYALDTAVAIGVTPVGAIASTDRDGVAPYIAEAVPDVTIVGYAGVFDVDAIQALKPDLILASWQTDDLLYAELSALAPTIVPPGIAEPGFDELRGWEYDVLVYAHALGKAEEAAGLLQDAHDRADSIREDASSALTGQRAVIVQWTAEGPVLLGPDTFSSVQLYRAGFSPVENVSAGPTSVGELADLDADWLFIAPVGEDGQTAYKEATVELDPGEAKVVVVDGAVWASSAGPLAAELILDDIERALD